MASLTMKTVNNVLQEIEKGKTRGKKGRDLSNDEIRDRCNRILPFARRLKRRVDTAMTIPKAR